MASKQLGIQKDCLVFTAKGKSFSFRNSPEINLSDFNIQVNDKIIASKRLHGMWKKGSKNACWFE